jgi:hypothetical protein
MWLPVSLSTKCNSEPVDYCTLSTASPPTLRRGGLAAATFVASGRRNVLKPVRGWTRGHT